MSPPHPPLPPSPFEALEWPERLTARVVEPGDRPRLLGYDVASDLAPHYGFAEQVFLSLTGNLPSVAVGRAFSACLSVLSPVSVAEAPSHAASLARLCGATTTGTLGTAAVALAQQAHEATESWDRLRHWLAGAGEELPTSALATTDAQRERNRELLALLSECGLDAPERLARLHPEACALAALALCGLTRREEAETALVLARLPVVAAEAFATPALRFREYPATLPDFVYEER